jgi:OMF family outer membrane factor
MMMKPIFALVLCTIFTAKAQQTIRFNHLNEVLNFATQNSIALKSGNAQIALAKYQTYYAKINRFSPRANVGYAMTDNLQLPVNFLPAKVFGGPAGTFKEAKFGQQYIQNLNITPQIDLINHAAWAKLASFKTSEILSEINQKLIRKTLSESVVAVYFNIVSLQEQIKILNQTLQNADSVMQIIQQKHNQGIIRSQDVNNATVNKLMIKDRIQQLQNGIEQQYNLLKSLCDVPVSSEILIENQNSNSTENVAILPNSLKSQQAELQVKYAQNELKVNQMGYYPTLSFIGSWALQENSNNHFFDEKARWIPQSYVGLRLNIVIPDANKYAQTKLAKTNLQLSEFAVKKLQLQQEIEQKQLQLEMSKAIDNELITKEILSLKNDTYQKNFNLFKQDIYPTENLLLSFNDVLNATLSQQVAKVQTAFQREKININNSIQ